MTFVQTIPALIALAIGAALFVRLCLRFPPALLLGVVGYSMITKSASVAYLETVDSFIIETSMTSHPVGATYRHAFYNLFIFVLALAVMRRLIMRTRPAIVAGVSRFGSKAYDKELRLALMTSTVLLGVQILNALMSPPYAFPGTGVTRQAFWANIRSPFVGELIGVLVIVVPAICGTAYAYGRGTRNRYFRRFSFWLTVAYGVYFLLSGQRFNGGLMATFYWVGAYWTTLWLLGHRPRLKRLGLAVFVTAAAFLFVSQLEIADRGISQRTGSTWNGFLYRSFVLQGNIYYAADVRTGKGDDQSTDLLLEDMSTTIRVYMPSSLGERYIDRGVNLAGSLPGNSILSYGYFLGLVPMALYALALGLAASGFAYFIATGRFLLLLPGAYLCLWAYTGYTQGSFSAFLDPKLPLFLGLMGVWLIRPRARRARRLAHSTPVPRADWHASHG